MICNRCETTWEYAIPGESNFCPACGGSDLRIKKDCEKAAWNQALDIWFVAEKERKAEKKRKAEERKAKKTKKEVLIQPV
jgi:hypothetical protein